MPVRTWLARRSATQVRWAIGLGSTTIAIVCVFAGWRIDSPYWSSVLVNVGTAFALAVPAIYLERIFERRITATKESIDEVSATVDQVSDRVDELTRETVTIVDEDRAAELKSAVGRSEAIAADASFASTYEGLVHGRETGATTPAVFVPVPEKRVTLRFEPLDADEAIRVTVIHDQRDAPTVDYTWRSGESARELFRGLDGALRNTYGRRAAPELAETVSTVFNRLGETLEAAQERRLDLPDAERGRTQVIEMVPGDWMITTGGAEKRSDWTTRFDFMEVINFGGPMSRTPPSGDPEDAERQRVLAVAYQRIVSERKGSRV
jgi:hypothetical protein